MRTLQSLNLGTKRPLRVAAYCRVSMGGVQDESYESQRNYFVREITSHSDWEFAGVFGDYARTGGSIRGRRDFQRMMMCAEEHQFDFILTKSISRFSRSTRDVLKTIQTLNHLDIGVYFLEESIDTTTGHGEMLIAALAAIAEMETDTISENVRMIQKAFNLRGTPIQRCSYGYIRQGYAWVIDPVKALRVKLGYLMAANAYCFAEIARRLNQFEEIDKTGREWNSSMVKRMLCSESYIGDILTNKLIMIKSDNGRKQIKNNGAADQYYIDGHHEAMIGRDLWNRIQELIKADELAGQKNFMGMQSIKAARECANADSLLDGVRKYLPITPGKWMRNRK
mgnify:CR=1 FL=1